MKKRLFTHTGVCWLIAAGAANVLGIASAQDTGDATTKVAAFAAGSDYLQTGPGTEATLPIGGKMVKVTLTGVPIQGSTGGTLGNTDTIVQRTEDDGVGIDRKSTRLNSSHLGISYAVFCLKKK